MPFQTLNPIPAKKNAVNALVGGLNDVVQGGMQNYQNALQAEQETGALERLGLSPEVARAARGNPKIMEALIGGQIQQKNEVAKQQASLEKNKIDQFEDLKNYDKIKETFGNKFADIWRASPVGGRTELLKHAIDSKLRGMDIENVLSPISQEEVDKVVQSTPEFKQDTKNWPKFDSRPQGYTPKEWNDEKKTWRKENAPVFEDLKTRVKNLKRDQLGVRSLNRLNETRKVGEGFEGSLINPETGEFYGLAQAAGLVSPESQQWVKEIARFQNRAKDAFGSRVTNFDLQSYMKQFPGLLNSYEGRKRILEMMKINYELDSLYDKALEKIYDHYGLSGVPQEEADKMARDMIKDEAQEKEAQFLSLDEQNQSFKPNQSPSESIDQFPPASEHNGKKIVDEETGEIFQSDGKQWKRIK